MNGQEEVLAAERRRAAALVARDATAMEACLDEQVVYVHATGMQQDRAQLLDYVRSGPTFHEVRLDPRSIRIHENVALLFGELYLLLQRTDGERVEARSLATEVWIRRADGWRLASFQSTRPA
jgi:ketosteroid isomerase-like protein